MITAQKMKPTTKNFFGKCDQIQNYHADLATFAEETLNWKYHFCAVDKVSPSLKAATQRCSSEKAFLKYAVNLQENTHANVSYQ